MADSISEPYFRLNRFFLKLLLLWPNDYKTTRNKIIFLGAITIATTITCWTEGREIYYLLFCPGDDMQKRKTMTVVSFRIYASIKHYHWICRMPKLTEIILQLERSSFKLENYFNQEVRDWTCATSKKKIKKDITKTICKARRTAKFILYFYISFSLIMIIGVYGATLLGHILLGKLYLFGFGEHQPYESYRFFDLSKPSQLFYETFIDCFVDLATVSVIMGSDCCLIGVIIFLTGQVRIIGIILENACGKNMSEEVKCIQLHKCINEINNIDSIIKKINECSSNVILCQYLISTVLFCLCVNILPKQDATMTFGITTFLVIFSTQLLLIAWFCQSFAEEFANLQNSIFNMDWTSSDPKFRRMLVFTIARVQKPLSVTMGKFGPINLKVYMTVIKTAYSFYTLISKMSSK